jgi:hypothetical protein
MLLQIKFRFSANVWHLCKTSFTVYLLETYSTPLQYFYSICNILKGHCCLVFHDSTKRTESRAIQYMRFNYCTISFQHRWDTFFRSKCPQYKRYFGFLCIPTLLYIRLYNSSLLFYEVKENVSKDLTISIKEIKIKEFSLMCLRYMNNIFAVSSDSEDNSYAVMNAIIILSAILGINTIRTLSQYTVLL